MSHLRYVPRWKLTMGYVPLFDSLTTGTLHGKWPDIGLWPVILSMADRFGNVDVTPQYIAGVTGLDVEHVIACIERFCSPDADSRSQENDGRRLEPLEEGRKWGWHVVNHSRYREKARLLARDSARTAEGLDAERKRKARESTRRPPKSPEVSPSDGNGDVDANGDLSRPPPSIEGSSSPLRSTGTRPLKSGSAGRRGEPKPVGAIVQNLGLKP